jgi:hypothetical protein
VFLFFPVLDRAPTPLEGTAMSLGQVIQSMKENLEALKKINENAAVATIVPDDLMTAEMAVAKMKEIFGDVYRTADCDVTAYASGKVERKLRVYTSELGWSEECSSYGEAIRCLVKRKQEREKSVDVLQSASEAIAEAVTPGVSPTVPLSDDEVRAAEEHQALLDAAAGAEEAKVYEETHPEGWDKVPF